MSKRRPKAKQSLRKAPTLGDGATGQRGERTPQAAAPSRRRPGWFYGKRPVLQFVLLFGVLMGLFQLACATSFVKDTLFPAYLRINANMSTAILAVFEDSVSVTGQSIHGRYSLTIERGCDAVEPSALFLAGVLAFPSPMLAKLPGMLIGTVCLMVLNLIRIVSLYYVGIYIPKWFHIMHVDVWQAIFIFLAILFWVLWALWATRERIPKTDAATTAG